MARFHLGSATRISEVAADAYAKGYASRSLLLWPIESPTRREKISRNINPIKKALTTNQTDGWPPILRRARVPARGKSAPPSADL